MINERGATAVQVQDEAKSSISTSCARRFWMGKTQLKLVVSYVLPKSKRSGAMTKPLSFGEGSSDLGIEASSIGPRSQRRWLERSQQPTVRT
jgi:hypothetical protein